MQALPRLEELLNLLLLRHLLHRHDLIASEEAVLVRVNTLKLLLSLCDLVRVVPVLSIHACVSVSSITNLPLHSTVPSGNSCCLRHEDASEEERHQQDEIAFHEGRGIYLRTAGRRDAGSEGVRQPMLIRATNQNVAQLK